MPPSSSAPRRLSPSAMALACGSLVLVGPALTVDAGILPAALILSGAAWIGHRRARRCLAGDGVGGLPPWLRRLSAVAVLVVAAVLAVVAARILASVVIAFPAAAWVLGVAVLIALVLPSLGRFREAALISAVLALPLLTTAGVRYEAEAIDAQGGAISGPILGIHPFQSTAIVIDGYGPFDLPFNDYVQPTGELGYGPVAYADVFERALHRIAQVHFAEGPPRAYEAFAGAKVEAFEQAPTRERLDVPMLPEDERRIRILSGSTGQRSRVELVCPGTREDPRGLQPDPVMVRMCPDRFAAEGSAGLGLTGRWTGYSEMRGNERLGLGRWLGWTRAEDDRGWWATLKEERIIAFVLVMLALIGLGGRRGGAQSRAAQELCAWAVAVLCATALIAVIALASAMPSPLVGLWERPALASDLWRPSKWLAALVIGSGAWELAVLSGHGGALRGRIWGTLAVAFASFVCASWVATTAWIAPDLWRHVGQGSGAGAHLLPMERWIIEVGAVVQDVSQCGVDVAEAAVAGGVVAVMVGLLAAIAGILPGLARDFVPGLGRLAPWAPLGIAAGLILSKQTHGGALLLAPALILTALVAAAIATSRDRGRRRWGSSLTLLATAAISIWALLEAWSATSRPGRFLDVCVAIGCFLTVALVIAAWARSGRSGP